MKKRRFLLIALMCCFVFAGSILVACNGEDSDFTVSFDTQGGSNIAGITVGNGQVIGEVAPPTKQCARFIGFALDAGGERMWNLQTDTVSADITLYAIWEDAHTWGETVWEYDENYHWKICSRCGAVFEKTAHVYDMDGKCECGATEITPESEFTFTDLGNNTWSVDGYSGSYIAIVIPSRYNGGKVISIGDYAFSGCWRLTSVTIPDSVTSIGDRAFYDCDGLTSITIPNSVTSIGDEAFRSCTGLTSITIPDGVTSIGDSVFFNCSGLTSVTIGDGVTSIGDSVFCNCSGLTSINIPDGVTSIGDYAFSGCRRLTSVTIPNSVTSIGDYVFYNCSGLTSINIPDGVTSIGDDAFSRCTRLTSINIPDGVTSIGGSAFYNCSGLTSINIPDGVTSIGNYAFRSCTGLTSVTIGEGVTSIGGYAFAYCTGLTSITIPDGVTSIGNYAFEGCTGLTEINWNAVSVEDFYQYGNYVFYNAGVAGDGIAVTFGESVEKLPAYLFYVSDSSYSPNIKSVIIGSDVTSIGSLAFSGCTGMTSVTIGAGVTSIGNYAFYNCSGLTSVTIPDGVTSIGDEAFYNCTGLTEINWNAVSVTDFDSGSDVFYNAGTAGEGITVMFGDSIDKIPSHVFRNCTGLMSVTIPDSVTSIGSSVFYNCTGLTSITIPDGVASIGAGAFRNCTGLTEINWNAVSVADFNSNSNVFYNAGTTGDGITVTFGENVEKIPADLFYVNSSSDRPNIKSVTIGSNVTSIGRYAFAYCTRLTSVTIGEGVTSIGYSAFAGCTGLTSITIPDGVTSIGNKAFEDCTGLTEINWNAVSVEDFGSSSDVFDYAGTAGDGITVTFGESVQRIPAYAFDDCDGLTSVTIGEGVTSIGTGAFRNCTGLTEINWNAVSVADFNLSSDVFDYAGTAGDGITVTFGDSVQRIPSYAFSGCTGLTSVTIGGGVTSIGDYAFYNCSGLTSVTIGDSVTSIGKDAFKYCENIATVNYMGSYTGDVAGWCGITFANAYANPLANGANLYIRDKLVNRLSTYNLSKIPDYAFYGCIGISEVIINSTLTSIGESAFENCYKLVEIYNQSSLNITMGSSDNGYIGYYARRIYVNDYIGDNTCFVEQDGYRFFYQDGKGYLVEYCGAETDLVLPDSFKVYNLFTYTVISQYEIYPYAFSDRTDITSITISDSVTSIGDYAFEDCTGLTSVTIGAGVTIIEGSAFSGCTGLTSVAIGDSVTSIGESAFAHCTDLTSVAIGAGVTSIGYGAFEDCTGLTSVTIPESVTSIGYEAFDGCTGLTSVYYTGDITGWCGISRLDEVMSSGRTLYIDGSKVEGAIAIPDGVTSIPSYAFAYQTGITSVTIPESVTSIGSSAFYGCTNLIQKENGVSYVDKWVIDCDNSVGEVTLRNDTMGIGDYAFAYCTGMTSITIPNSVTSIGDCAFEDCTRLTEINWNAVSVADLDSDVFKDAGTAGNGIAVTFGESVEKIPAYLFDVSWSSDSPNIKSVTIGSNVTSIGSLAFYNCSGLTSVTIGKGVKSIGDYAFWNCSGLTSVYYTGDIAGWCGISGLDEVMSGGRTLYIDGSKVEGAIAIPDGVTSIGDYAFYSCDGLTSITIPDSVTSIGCGAFYNCSGLTSVTIPDSVTRIGDYAFAYCTGLTSVAIVDSVTSIGDYAFYDCSGLTSVTIGAGVTSIGESAFEDCTSLTSVTIGAGVTSIGESAFEDCTGLTSVTIGDSVTSIGYGAFRYCYKLVEVYNKSSLSITAGSSSNGYIGCYAKNVYTAEGGSRFTDTSDGYRFLYDGTNGYLIGYYGDETELTLPASFTAHNGTEITEYGIYDYAFYSCDGLTSVTIGDSVTSIGYKAFEDCAGLTSVTIGDSVTSIGDDAFYSCDGLTSVTIGDSVTSIGDRAFFNCSGLTSINIPDSVTSIGAWAFYGCRGLTSVTIGEGVTSIGDYAFYYCTGLTSVTIGEGVTSIGSYAFFYCSGLTSVYYTGDITGWCGISGLSAVMASGRTLYIDGSKVEGAVTIPDGVTSIPSYAFAYQTGLTSVTIPDSVTSIGNYAFYGCSGLTSVTIGAGVTSIGNYAFSYCTGLLSVTFEETSGWFVSRDSSATSGTDISADSLFDKSTAAEYLKSMYDLYYWKRNA